MTLTETTIVAALLLFAACLVQHSSAAHHQLQAVFSMGGIKGHVLFTQDKVDDPTTIVVNLTGINETLKWSIHQLPMIYDGNAAISCSAEAVGELFDPGMAMESPSYSSMCGPSNATRFEACAVGDLGRMLGDFTANMPETNYTNINLVIPIRGPHSIMGRTLVFYKQDGVTPKACALITPPQSMMTAVAVFKAPVAGFVYLRQVDENSDTTVYVNLFHVDDSKSESHFKWQIDQGLVSDDFTDLPSYCNPPGEIFNPMNANDKNCNETNQDHCPIGDLSSKHGNVTVSRATNRGSSTKAAFTDTNLPLFGAKTVIGKSIVLLSTSDPAEPVACAKILTVAKRVLRATFKANTHKGVSGYFEFSQASPFDPTNATISLMGLQDMAEGYHVHEYPNPRNKEYLLNESCSAIVAGGHWNPFDIDLNLSPPSGSGTDDEYEIGDLSGKYGSFLNLTSYDEEHTDYNLPLFGRYSIQGRSIVIHNLKKDGNLRWVCANLVQVMDEATTFIMKTDAAFKGPTVSGRILIDQYKSALPNVASEESTIFIDVEYTSNSSRKTDDHRWDVRMNPVGSQGCASLPGNFNPFEVDTTGDYSSVCSPTNMLRCQVGDLSGKHGKLSVGRGQLLFTDINLPLFGRNAVAGRGVAMRAKDSGSSAIGCTNIEADTSLFEAKSLIHVKKSSISQSEFAKFMAKKLSIPEWRIFKITTEKTGNNEACLTVNFGIIGNADQVKEPSDKLDNMVRDNPEALEDYEPMKDECAGTKSGARGIQINIFSLAIAATAAGAMKALI